MELSIDYSDYTKVLGFLFIFIGFLFFLLNIPTCDYLCDYCTFKLIKPCVLLSLFVGIIFTITGANIIILYNPDKDKLPPEYSF